MRDLFALDEGLVYLDGNSLGAMPRAAAQRVAEVVTDEWGSGLVRSWNDAGWNEHPRRIGDKLAPLIGARPGEVVVTDTTSINLYKALHAALAAGDDRRSLIVTERDNFPTDVYIADAVARQRGAELRLVESENLLEALSAHVGVLMLTEVDYRTGSWWDMAEVTAAAHHEGIVVIWDLCHSAGAVPVDLTAAHADFAVGCSYKYLNGGPGAPAFVWAAPRHSRRLHQPLTGWWGHAAPFEFATEYRPAPGSAGFLTGTQPIISLAAMECGLDSVLTGAPDGDMTALRHKSLALTDLFIDLVEGRCADRVEIVTPRDQARRGSHVSVTLPGAPDGAVHGLVQALISRNVIGDFRAGAHGEPDLARFGFTPLYTRFVDVWHAVDHLAAALDAGEHLLDEHLTRRAVT